MWTVNLANTYHLDLKEQRAQVVDWDNMSVKAKMRRFFAGAQWPAHIKSVSASSAGKEGVFFLYKADKNNIAQPEASPSYVVKLTNAPQRILFAEYVLKNFGRAKIPKSLVVRLDWDDYPDDLDTNIDLGDATTDDGLKLVHLLRRQTLRHPNVTQGSLRERTYDTNLKRLVKSAGNRPRYLVIMKGFKIAQPNVNLQTGDPFRSTIADPFLNVPHQPTIVYPLANSKVELGEWLEETNANWLNQIGKIASTVTLSDLDANKNYQQGNRLKEIVWGILINKRILSHADLLKKAGRVLAADTIIRNGDRLQGEGGPNLANIFFAAKTYPQNVQKINNPVAVIDNEALLTIYDPEDPPCDELGQRNDSLEKRVDKYLNFVLKNGKELAIDPVSKLIGNGNPASNLKQLVDDFDTTYFSSFVEAIVPPQGHRWFDYPLLRELYADDGRLLGRPNGTYRHFSADPANQEWQTVRENLKAGFAEAIDDLQRNAAPIKGFEYVYRHLLQDYGLDNDFDNKALNVTQYYVNRRVAVQRNAQNNITGFTVSATHEDACFDIRKNLLQVRYPINDCIEKSLTFGLAPGKNQQPMIDQAQSERIRKYFHYIPTSIQNKLDLGEPKSIIPNTKKARLKRIRVVTLALLVYFEKYVQGKLTAGIPLRKTIDRAVAAADEFYISKIKIPGCSFYKAEESSDKKELKKHGIADRLHVLGIDSGIGIGDYYWKDFPN